MHDVSSVNMSTEAHHELSELSAVGQSTQKPFANQKSPTECSRLLYTVTNRGDTHGIFSYQA